MADQHGARTGYGPLLARSFPEAAVRLARQGPDFREFELEGRPGGPGADRRMRVLFAPRADAAAFPTALASCLAKYARETCMGAFNAFFGELQPDLKPTAGYTTDGRRWVIEARPALSRAGLAAGVLARER